MEDYLIKRCLSFNLTIIYTKNKYMILSYSRYMNKPILRIHNIFKNCPKEVADAIIGYYTNFNTQKII